MMRCMKLHMPRTIIFIAVLALFASDSLMAQETIGLHITSLTAAERDSLTLRIHKTNDLKLVFACVPAGVIVLSSDQQGASRDALRLKAVQTIIPVVAETRIASAELTQQDAEAACANARRQ